MNPFVWCPVSRKNPLFKHKASSCKVKGEVFLLPGSAKSLYARMKRGSPGMGRAVPAGRFS
jgi:hypothetical protein